jgi:hypothetical protein
MSCIEVCPNACECIAIFLRENVCTIEGNLQNMSLGGSFIMSNFLVS